MVAAGRPALQLRQEVAVLQRQPGGGLNGETRNRTGDTTIFSRVLKN